MDRCAKPFSMEQRRAYMDYTWQYFVYEGHHKNIDKLQVAQDVLLWFRECDGDRMPVAQEQYVIHILCKHIKDCVF